MPSLLRYARAASGAYLALALAQGLGREAVAQSPSRVLDEVVLQVTSVQDSSNTSCTTIASSTPHRVAAGSPSSSLTSRHHREQGTWHCPSPGPLVQADAMYPIMCLSGRSPLSDG